MLTAIRTPLPLMPLLHSCTFGHRSVNQAADSCVRTLDSPSPLSPLWLTRAQLRFPSCLPRVSRRRQRKSEEKSEGWQPVSLSLSLSREEGGKICARNGNHREREAQHKQARNPHARIHTHTHRGHRGSSTQASPCAASAAAAVAAALDAGTRVSSMPAWVESRHTHTEAGKDASSRTITFLLDSQAQGDQRTLSFPR